jgi:hypothetical protein
MAPTIEHYPMRNALLEDIDAFGAEELDFYLKRTLKRR